MTDLEIRLVRETSIATTAKDFAACIDNIGLSAEDIDSNADLIRELCRTNGIDDQAPELQEIFQFCTEHKEKKRRQELKELVKELDLAVEDKEDKTVSTEQIIEKAHSFHEEVNRIETASNTAWKKIIASYDTLKAAWQKDTSNHFAPELFERLPFPNGTVSYIGARTGRGKTTAMVTLALEALFPLAAKVKPRNVLFISLEESLKQILRRLSLCLAYRNSTASTKDLLLQIINPFDGRADPKAAYASWIRGYPIQDDTDGAFVQAIAPADEKIREAMNSGRLILADGIGTSLSIIEAVIQHCKADDLVIVDYIQKIPAKKESRSGNPDLERIRIGSEALLEAANSIQCVIISGAQLNREGQMKKQNDTFADSDFRGCGDIEQDGHNLICIGRTGSVIKHTIHYYQKIKTRESELTNEYRILDFAGGYSYMRDTGNFFYDFEELEEKEKQNLEKTMREIKEKESKKKKSRKTQVNEEYDPTNPEHAKDPLIGWYKG